MPNPKFQILSKPMTLPPMSRCSCLSVTFGYVALFDVLAALDVCITSTIIAAVVIIVVFRPSPSGIVRVQWKPGQY